MACTRPITIPRPRSLMTPELGGVSLIVPCGRCVGCSLDYGRMWSVRCYHESLLHSASYFLTLTVDDDHLHYNADGLLPSLDPCHLVLFLKRLRRRGQKVRFFACGEYGSRTMRPHYHMIVFGLVLTDLRPLSKVLSESPWLDSVWQLGKVAIGSVTPESIAYCCRYTTKKVLGRPASWYHERGLYPEFVRMSRRPGIGHDFFSRYRTDIYNTDSCFLPSGFSVKVPRYYDKLFDDSNPLEFRELVKPARLARSLLRSSEAFDIRRLQARDSILRFRLSLRSDVF